MEINLFVVCPQMLCVMLPLRGGVKWGAMSVCGVGWVGWGGAGDSLAGDSQNEAPSPDVPVMYQHFDKCDITAFDLRRILSLSVRWVHIKTDEYFMGPNDSALVRDNW